MTTTISLPTNFDDMVKAMLKCEQTKGQSVYQHGVSVYKHLQQLIAHIKNDEDLIDWKIPTWLLKYGKQIVDNLHQDEDLSLYCLYHDCGKPFCKTIDENGKVHFPNHAEVSKDVWLSVGGSQIVANLIGDDMVIHTASSEEISEKLKEWSMQDACALLLIALAEIHSNAKLFNGIDSQSFKTKFKTIERRGNQICKFLFGEVT